MEICDSTLLDGALIYALVAAAFVLGMGVTCLFAMTPSLCARCECSLGESEPSFPPFVEQRERCDDEHVTKTQPGVRHGGAA